MQRDTRRALGQTRQDELLNYLRTFRSGHVAELSEVLGASPSTIRRDLDDLQDRGLVERVHGGATITVSGVEAGPAARAHAHPSEKRRIGEAAAGLIASGTTVLISGGTTTESMLPFLGEIRDLTVITNGVQIAAGVADYPNVHVIVLGGELRRESMSLLGHLASETLREFTVDQVFMGAFGLDARDGVTGANLQESQTDRALLESARHVVVVADGSKLQQRGPVRVAPLSAVDTLVTDRGVPEAVLAELRDQGVEVLTC